MGIYLRVGDTGEKSPTIPHNLGNEQSRNAPGDEPVAD